MNRKEIKAEAKELGFPTAEEMNLFGERLGLGCTRSDLTSDSDYTDIPSIAKGIRNSLKQFETYAKKVIEQEGGVQEGDIKVLRNVSPKYLQGVAVIITEIERRQNGNVYWGRILEMTGKKNGLGDLIGFAVHCFEDPSQAKLEAVEGDGLLLIEGFETGEGVETGSKGIKQIDQTSAEIMAKAFPR